MFGKLKEIIGLGEYDEEFDELDDAEEEEKNQIEPIIQNTQWYIRLLIFIVIILQR